MSVIPLPIPLPTATIDDADMACALLRAVAVINPALDLLSGTDPLGVKDRTRDPNSAGVLDAVASLLNSADVPGTAAWDAMDLDARINWWVRRIGALDTILVAAPGIFGAAADRLPIQDFLGFSNQSIVLCAVAREHGVSDKAQQVRMLAAVLCDRDLNVVTGEHGAVEASGPESESMPESVEWTLRTPAKALWQLAGLMRAIGDELVKRPRPRRIFRYLGMLPVAGAVADYLGEYGAMVRAAKEGRRWIAEHAAAEPV